VNVAVLDIGTNSIHMLVVRIDADLKAHVLDKAKEMVRLGQGTFETGRLDEATQQRALGTLKGFARLAQKRGAQRILAVATSAVREADNGGTFLQEVYSETGIHPKIITGAEEARLVFKAVQSAMPLDETPVLVVDLGGGSVEFACGSSRGLLWTSSLRLGGQRLETMALEKGEPSPERRTLLRAALAAEIAPLAARAKASGVKTCYLTSGSAVATLKLLRERAEAKSDDERVSRKALVSLDEELARTPAEKRRQMPGLEPSRASQIVGAVAFFRELADGLGLDELAVSDRGLREGLVQDFLDQHGAEIQWELTEPNARRRAVLSLAERLGYDAAHAHHVAHLALSLFDATAPLHGLDEQARELFEYGALLHDVGYAVAEKAHHKHSEYLVLHGLQGGFSEEEIRAIAALARYHRKAGPKESHENWAAMTRPTRDLVERAEGLLRIADALDRSHARVVAGAEARIGEAALDVTVRVTGPAELEMWAAQRKAEWFERAYGMPVVFHVQEA
jgi:exopolyphosphatase / guanosine-5'-triphosphate,3'-diphosphate pyrophosphatase